MAKVDKYIVVLLKGEHLVNESRKFNDEWRASRWVRQQNEWWEATNRKQNGNVWTADEYTFRIVKINA